MSFFTRNHKKALVRLQQVDKVTCQVVKELGFGFKARKKGNRLIVVTCSSVLPEDIQGDEIVVDRFRSKSKNEKYEINPQDQVTVESIHMPKQDGIRYLSGTGGNEEEFFYMDNKDDIRERRLSAFAFEDKKIVELQFENKQGPCHFTWKSNKDFDVKKAKGAPIIHKDRAGSFFVIGLLSTNSSGQLYPLLFTKDFDVPRSPSDEPNQVSDQHSDQRPSTSGLAGNESSQASDQHSDPRTASIDAVTTEPSQPSDEYSGTATNSTYNIDMKGNAKAAVGDSAQFINVESSTDQPAEKDYLSSRAQGTATNSTYNIDMKGNAKAAVGNSAQFINVESPTDQPAEKDYLSSRAQAETCQELVLCFGDQGIQTIEVSEAATKVTDLLNLDKLSLEDPPKDIMEKYRRFCSYLKSNGRVDIVEKLREQYK